ncbi:MAG TPA: HAMP domain-containing sensor histidine kinase [Candidatus Eremiobacteraceae bacterium]|nr:HAMP domain-containing sensor histidine kinase [Candidatus Eremiobacteraceae bacterium]
MSDRARPDEVIHDIRNRLAVARANVEAFIDGKLKATPDRLKVVLQALDQLGALLNDIRAAQVAALQVRLVEIDVCELLDREYHAIEPVAADRGIAVSISRCPVPLTACKRFIADPVRIAQIVSNVLLNAVRYTPRGGVVAIDCMHEADRLQITISDSGPGVRDEERDKIFLPGVRGSAGTEARGSGHGLAIAKEFVEAHGGTIDVSSNDKKGARFTIRLPGTLVAGAASESCRHCAAGPRSSM